jgi:NADH-quinone oxidoreductase subunit J
LTLRERKDSKFMTPGDQVRVKRADRVRIVSMASEGGMQQEQDPTDRKEQI